MIRTETGTSTRAAVVVVMGLLLAALLPALPAEASQINLCQGEEICQFKNVSYNGGIIEFTGSDGNYYGNSYALCSGSCGANDSASSVGNQNSCNVQFYSNSFGGGASYILSSNTQRSSWHSIDLGDVISSHYRRC